MSAHANQQLKQRIHKLQLRAKVLRKAHWFATSFWDIPQVILCLDYHTERIFCPSFGLPAFGGCRPTPTNVPKLIRRYISNDYKAQSETRIRTNLVGPRLRLDSRLETSKNESKKIGIVVRKIDDFPSRFM